MQEEDSVRFATENNFGVAVGLKIIKALRPFTLIAGKINPPQDVEVDMIQFGTEYTFPPTSGESMEMVSNNALDTGQTIRIIGLDTDGKEKTEEFETTGLTPVDIGTWSAINDMINADLVTAVVGTLVIQTTGGAGNTYAQIEVDAQRSSDAVFVAPSDREIMGLGLIHTIRKAVGSDAGAVVRVYTIRPGGVVRVLGFASGMQRSGDTSPEFKNELPDSLPAGTKVVITIEATATGADFLVRLPILLINKKEL